MADETTLSSTPSLRQKLKQSLCFCCFGNRRGHHLPLRRSPRSPSEQNSSVIWDKSKGLHDLSLSEIKEKCRTVLGIPGGKHRRHASAVEFGYDPLSYALNFEDGFDYDDGAPLKNFCARLPPVPTAVS